MHYSIYQYLKTRLHSALEKAYPEQYPHLSIIPITFSSITPDPLTDLATPYPLKISDVLGLPVATVSTDILNHFQFNQNFLTNTTDDIYYRGFFNFRMSSTFLLRSVYETSTDECLFKPVSATNKPEIFDKIELLLQKNQPENRPSLDLFITFPLPHSTSEHKAARLIAITSPEEIHSAKTRKYFTRRLCDEATIFYRKCPVQTDDAQLSEVRFCVLEAIYKRLLHITQMTDQKV